MHIPFLCKSRHIARLSGVAVVSALFWQTSAAQTSAAQTSSAALSATPGAAAAVTDPRAKVPAIEYRSVFKETSLGVEKDSDNWRKANDEVGKFTRGHVDILKWEEQEAAKAMKAPADKPVGQPATPKAAMPAPASNQPTSPSTTKPIAAPAHKH